MHIGDLVTRDSGNVCHYQVFGIIIAEDKDTCEVWGNEDASYKVFWFKDDIDPYSQNQWWHSRFLEVVK